MQKASMNVTNNVYVNWPAGRGKGEGEANEDGDGEGGQGKTGWAGLVPAFVKSVWERMGLQEWMVGRWNGQI